MIKHFLKTVALFAGMILLGLLGIFLVSHYGSTVSSNTTGASVAK